ncbi:MAG: acyl carrier protein [Frankiaceae bacterium]
MKEISERVLAVLAARCDIPAADLSERTLISSLGLDSLTLMEVSLSLEHELRRPVDDGAFAQAETVGDLVRAMEWSPSPA